MTGVLTFRFPLAEIFYGPQQTFDRPGAIELNEIKRAQRQDGDEDKIKGKAFAHGRALLPPRCG